MAKNTKQKYYVVWEGVTPGIYKTWAECLAQVKGYPNARYKSFPSRAEAEEAFKSPPGRKYGAPKSKDKASAGEVIWNSISVDAACSGNPGVMEYRGVRTDTGDVLFHQGPYRHGTNNIGEFLALVHCLAMLHRKGDEKTPIYSDSRIAMGWVRQGKAKTKLEHSAKTRVLHELIERAELWLSRHTWKNPIFKWETEAWGEIPADFGRKS